MLFFNRKKIVTHNGSFHADDIFACATIGVYLDRKRTSYKIIRTRNESIIHKADYVVDVGNIYNPVTNRFDHHQPGGAGVRDNGIPYASFGLVWKKFGPRLCNGNQKIADDIDRRLVQPIDAIDNGISITESNEYGLYDYGIYGIISAYQATFQESGNPKQQDKNFVELVNFFKKVIIREITQTQDRFEMIDRIQDVYDHSERKDIVELPFHVSIGPLMQVFEKYPETMYIVARSNENWKAMALRKAPCSFENRKPFPESWAGKRDQELQKITGVDDALFCHNARFMVVTMSKEGAWKLAQKSLENN